MILNHYRSIDSAILEIENCTFHFAAREELNDPIEGYVRVFWQGDKAAWEGLFRNYICSLSEAMTLYALKGDEEVLCHRSLLVDMHRFDDVPEGAFLKELGDAFLREEKVLRIAAGYGEQGFRVDQRELALMLTCIHYDALVMCLEHDKARKVMPDDEADRLIKAFSGMKMDFLPLELRGKPLDSRHRAGVTTSVEAVLKEMIELKYLEFGLADDSFLYGPRCDAHGNIIRERGITGARQHRNWMTVAMDFPGIYVNQLKDMIYPESYVVCFSTEDDNSVMWGNYADHHRGVCLVYETDADNGLTVWGEHAYACKAKPVCYDGEIIERNFFESFGRLTRLQIKAWLTGTDGLSGAYRAFSDKAAWQDRYWEAYEAKTYRKLKAWEYEREYRLALSNSFYTFNDPNSRNLRYDPKILKGVIFGINTSEYDKKRIIEKLMLHTDEYDDLTFYQAEYDEEKQRITVHRKSLWDLSRLRNGQLLMSEGFIEEGESETAE